MTKRKHTITLTDDQVRFVARLVSRYMDNTFVHTTAVADREFAESTLDAIMSRETVVPPMGRFDSEGNYIPSEPIENDCAN